MLLYFRVTRSTVGPAAAESEESESERPALKDITTDADPTMSSLATPTPRKRTLYKEVKHAAMFTPPMEIENTPQTPRTIVKRQLRSRSHRK